jgi:hypothetical protein
MINVLILTTQWFQNVLKLINLRSEIIAAINGELSNTSVASYFKLFM